MASTLETTALATSRGQAAELAVLVHSIADPVDTGIVTDGLVSGVNKDDLKVLVHSVLVNPVGVEDAESSALAANALLSKVAKVAGRLQLGDTSVNRLTIVNTLQNKNKMNTFSLSVILLKFEHGGPHQLITAGH